MILKREHIIAKVLKLVEDVDKKDGLLSVYVSDGINNVRFVSDSEEEIKAVRQYFNMLYNVSENKEENYGEIFEVYSIKSKLCNEIIDTFPLVDSDDLFYDMQGGKVYEDDELYCLIRKNMLGVTVFLKKERITIYLRLGDLIENVHLSQVIKEPINSYKIANGYMLLHCAACSYAGKVIVFPAQKYGGKSTIVMGMLCDEKSKYLGNDSLFIKPEINGISVMKNPHAIRLGTETINNNLYLRNYLSVKINQNKAKMYGAPLVLNNKTQIVSCSLDQIYGSNKIERNGMQISNFIFPKLIPNEKINEINMIDNDKAKELLKTCYSIRDHRINWLPYYKKDLMEKMEQKTLQDVLTKMEFDSYELQFDGEIDTAVKIITNKIG